jgi:exosortase K
MSTRRAIVLALMALVLFALKRHYSTAEVEDLRWILGPTSTLVASLSGSTFEFERGAGYLSRELFFVIEKSCAGVNFMIAASGLTGFVLSRDRGGARPGAWVVGQSLVLGYAAAVLVNTIRILIAIRLASVKIAAGWWTAPRIHRLEGIAVYFGGLLLLNLVARGLARARPRNLEVSP